MNSNGIEGRKECTSQGETVQTDTEVALPGVDGPEYPLALPLTGANSHVSDSEQLVLHFILVCDHVLVCPLQNKKIEIIFKVFHKIIYSTSSFHYEE